MQQVICNADACQWLTQVRSFREERMQRDGGVFDFAPSASGFVAPSSLGLNKLLTKRRLDVHVGRRHVQESSGSESFGASDAVH